MTKPIVFVCEEMIRKTGPEIAAEIADMDRWREFGGYGSMPGIEHAEYETRTDEMVGSRIRVKNRDGSTHVEVIEIWNPDREIQMRLCEFSPPVSRLASHFIEHWDFEPVGEGTRALRAFEMHPVSALTRPVLWVVSRLAKKAIARHLAEMAKQADG